MPKRKRKRTPAEQHARRKHKQEFMTCLVNGKQKRIPCPPEIEGLPVGEFIAANADPIWLHEHEMWEMISDGSDAHVTESEP